MMTQDSLALVFPGQGSQKVGMMGDAYESFKSVRDTFEEAATVVDYDMWATIEDGPQEALNLTETTQPVLLTCSVALWRAWQEQGGVMPGIMAGHSLGEFSALVCAGALSFTDAVALVRRRGEFMQTAVPVGVGAMAVVLGLDDSAINEICATLTRDGASVSPVNYNSPGQVVIAGHSAAVEAACAALKKAGATRTLPLPVSAPFHTSLMKPAGEQLAQAIADIAIAVPSIPVVHNVNAQIQNDPEKIRSLLVEQIYSPVLWTGCMRFMINRGTTRLVECGPGKVLSGLARRIDKSLTVASIEQPEALTAAISEIT